MLRRIRKLPDTLQGLVIAGALGLVLSGILVLIQLIA